MADFVKFELEDGSEVFFETAESDLVAQHTGDPGMRDPGFWRTGSRVSPRRRRRSRSRCGHGCRPMRSHSEVGVKVGGEVNWWFFAKSQGEAAIKVTATWSAAGTRESGTG